MPCLVVLSGRDEQAVQKIFSDLKSRPVDAEELTLLYNIHSKNISGHLGRGYIILGTKTFLNNKNMLKNYNSTVKLFSKKYRLLVYTYIDSG